MIFVEVVQTSGGRTGHKMKDYLTAIIYYFLSGYKIILNDTWNFPEDNNDHDNHMNMFNLIDKQIITDRPNNPIYIDYSLANWSGMQYNKFKEIEENLNSNKKKNANNNIILRLKGASRILLSDVYNWEKNKHIVKGKYKIITNYLRYRYYQINKYVFNKVKALKIAMHIRKGDVYMRPLHQSVKYYENIIKQIKTIKVKKVISIYSEKWKNYDEKDVYDLKKLEDEQTKINIIFSICLYEYFSEILNNFIFVPTLGQGSFSDLLINYKEDYSIIIINHEHRQNKFVDDMNGKLFFTDNNGYFQVNKLINILSKL